MVGGAILFLSRLIILELIDVVFEEDVELGGLLPFIALVVVLLGTEALIQVRFDSLGPSDRVRTQSESGLQRESGTPSKAFV